jgi:quercetin dioxygenase-like cupin family protein
MRVLGLCAQRAFTLGLLAGAALVAQNARETFENDQVLINERHGQPHDHKLNRVMIYFQDGGEILHYLDGKDVTLKWAAGDVRWSPASGMHVSEIPDSMRIASANAVMLVDIGIKKAGDPGKVVSAALDPLRVDPQDCKLEFENSQVRVIRVRIGPRGSVPMHEHLLNHVVVYLTDQNVRETSPEGKAEAAQHKAGDYRWSGPTRHKVENLGSQPIEAVVVELKN